jgi:hypothetical protein
MVVLMGMGDPPAYEPDEILVEVVAVLAEALDWCGCCREESWRA